MQAAIGRRRRRAPSCLPTLTLSLCTTTLTDDELQASLGSVDGTANRLTTGKTGLGEFDWISTNPVLNQQQHTYNKWSKQRWR
ncbi:Vacuolar protein [Trichinella pseudospiralis]